MLPALVNGQSQQRPLSYRGWALGISLDSAATLATAQIGRPLACVGMDTKTMFCQTNGGSGYANLYFSPFPRRLEELAILTPLDRRASRDSLKKWFTREWGSPLSGEASTKRPDRNQRPMPETDIIGRWRRDGFVLGMAGVSSYDTTRMISVSIRSPAREIRLLKERTDTSRKRR